jgi:hypothetical protein
MLKQTGTNQLRKQGVYHNVQINVIHHNLLPLSRIGFTGVDCGLYHNSHWSRRDNPGDLLTCNNYDLRSRFNLKS